MEPYAFNGDDLTQGEFPKCQTDMVHLIAVTEVTVMSLNPVADLWFLKDS